MDAIFWFVQFTSVSIQVQSTSVSIQLKGGKHNLGKGLTTHPDGNLTTQNFSSTTMYTSRCCILETKLK
jgi:hypothetical protein